MKIRKRIVSIFMALVLILSTVMVGVPSSVAEAKSKAKIVGKTFVSGQYRYKVVSVKKKSGTVTMTGGKTKAITFVAMPETVRKDGYTFKVTAISNNAFKGYKKLKSVTTNAQLKIIGKNAFNGCSKLKNIDITTTKLTSVGKNALKGISAKAVVKVPSNKVSSYQKMLKNAGQKATVMIRSNDKADTVKPENTSDTDSADNIADAIQPENTTTVSPKDNIADAITEKQITEAATTEKTTEVVTTERATEVASTEKTTEAATTEQTTEKVPPHTHSYANWETVVEATCLATGMESSTCIECGQKATRTLPKKEHEFGKWVEVWQASCVAPGLEKRMCDGCGLAESRQIAVLEHALEPTRTTAATCTSGGKQYFECTICKQVFFNIISKPLGHAFEEEYTVDKVATCNPGSKSRHCSRPDCDEKTDVTVIPAEHQWGEYVVDWEGCTSTGRQHRTCTICKTTESVTTEPKGHVDSGEFVCEQEATCTAPGVKRKRCSRCNVILASEIISAKGHDFSIVVSVDETKGLETKKCSRCDEKQTQVIHKAGHIYDDKFTVDVLPGCNFGIQSRHCKIEGCDAYTEWTPIPGTGHNFDDKGHCTNEGCESIPDIIGFNHRFVWGVAFVADLNYCEGFVDDHGNHVASIGKTTIIDIARKDGKPDGEIIGQIFNTIEMTAPAAKAGYKFAGWQEVKPNGVGELDTNLTCTIDWRSMGRIYKAVYVSDGTGE